MVIPLFVLFNNTSNTLQRIYWSGIQPYLVYGISALGREGKTHRNKILHLLKRAFRLMFFCDYKTQAMPLFISPILLPLESSLLQVSCHLNTWRLNISPPQISNLFNYQHNMHSSWILLKPWMESNEMPNTGYLESFVANWLEYTSTHCIPIVGLMIRKRLVLQNSALYSGSLFRWRDQKNLTLISLLRARKNVSRESWNALL